METIRPPGFSEPAPYIGYHAENIGETGRFKLYRRVDGREHYLVSQRTGRVRTISLKAATLIGLWLDRSITAGECRLIARIFNVRLGKGVLS